ncbi:MAG: glycosyltransferase family 2 protein [Calditrichaceae bacterium]
MVKDPVISVVIPHFNGKDILNDCLESLYKNTYDEFETILIDNGSTDGSQDFIRDKFPQVRLIRNKANLGYAGGCNQGIGLSNGSFVLLLNNDTVMPENFLTEMYSAIKSDETIAAVQPKIISIQNNSLFDYSGGAGGEMDLLGYPFARGRIFDTVEADEKQYDNIERQVFWTSGCALLLRKSITDRIGILDEDFFAHQEEIDLNWRAQLAGYKNVVTTRTHIKHFSGYTLRGDNERKMYYNHRNNLIMMLKNYSLPMLLMVFPIRIVFELATIAADGIFWEGKRARSVMRSLLYLFTHPSLIYGKRRETQGLRKVSDRQIIRNMYPGSVVIDHFIRKLTPNECILKFRKNNQAGI